MPKLDVRILETIQFFVPRKMVNNLRIEISAEFGPLPEHPEFLAANVFAEVNECGMRGFLYTEQLPKEFVDKGGYFVIAKTILDNETLMDELRQYIGWVTDHGMSIR